MRFATVHYNAAHAVLLSKSNSDASCERAEQTTPCLLRLSALKRSLFFSFFLRSQFDDYFNINADELNEIDPKFRGKQSKKSIEERKLNSS